MRLSLIVFALTALCGNIHVFVSYSIAAECGCSDTNKPQDLNQEIIVNNQETSCTSETTQKVLKPPQVSDMTGLHPAHVPAPRVVSTGERRFTIKALFDTTGFVPRWVCGKWTNFLGWLHIGSDLGVFSAYMAIPILLTIFIFIRQDIPFPKIFILFALFIFSCGISHLTDALMFWWPWYRFLTGVKLITAVVSWVTVIALIPILPKLIMLPKLDQINQQLEARLSELQRSNKELEKFAHMVSHNLKEPLRGIHHYAHFILEEGHSQLSEQNLARLKSVTTVTEQLEKTINKLLYYAEFGNTRLKREWTDLNHILQGSLVSLKALIDESKATININSSLPMVDCDPVAILEVFNNLIANAIKYRRFNEPCIITIGWTEKYTDLDNKEEIIYIQDNGVGIPEPLYERIFMPFKRFHTLSNNKGFGLGLTIVAEIIRLHSGRIWVESKIDHGSTFYFTLQSSKSKVKHAL